MEYPALGGLKALCLWHLGTWARGGLGHAGEGLESIPDGFSNPKDSMIL